MGIEVHVFSIPESVGYHCAMKPAGSLLKLFDEEDANPDAPARGPLFPRPIFRALLVVFGVSLVFAVDWFGLLLLNSQGVVARMGPVNALRVTAILMGGVAVTSALFMAHYRRVYSYISEENVFFAITFALSFLLGAPCAVVGIFA
ncbi:MAG: hypothetical protein M3397_02480 [Actinomycetota bacterium]|nr:hypothetical protein [Actinomycetota bacterium]